MRKVLIIILCALAMFGYAQVSPLVTLRIANDVTTFDQNVVIGTNVYDIDADELWVAHEGVYKDSTLTTASTSFTRISNYFKVDASNISQVMFIDGDDTLNESFSHQHLEYALVTEIVDFITNDSLEWVYDSLKVHRDSINHTYDSLSVYRDSLDIYHDTLVEHRTDINAINVGDSTNWLKSGNYVYLKDINNYVGINTESPAGELDVRGVIQTRSGELPAYPTYVLSDGDIFAENSFKTNGYIYGVDRLYLGEFNYLWITGGRLTLNGQYNSYLDLSADRLDLTDELHVAQTAYLSTGMILGNSAIVDTIIGGSSNNDKLVTKGYVDDSLLVYRDTLEVHRININTNDTTITNIYDSLLVHRDSLASYHDTLVEHNVRILALENATPDSIKFEVDATNISNVEFVIGDDTLNESFGHQHLEYALVTNSLTPDSLEALEDSSTVHRTVLTNIYDSLLVHRDSLASYHDTLVDHRIDINTNLGKDTTGIFHINRALLDTIDAADTTRWGHVIDTTGMFQDLSSYIEWTDTTSLIATKYDLDTLTLGLWEDNSSVVTLKTPRNVNLGTEDLYADSIKSSKLFVDGAATIVEKLILEASLTLGDEFYDGFNEAGSAGQILSSTGSKTDWIDASGSMTYPSAGNVGVTENGTSWADPATYNVIDTDDKLLYDDDGTWKYITHYNSIVGLTAVTGFLHGSTTFPVAWSDGDAASGSRKLTLTALESYMQSNLSFGSGLWEDSGTEVTLTVQRDVNLETKDLAATYISASSIGTTNIKIEGTLTDGNGATGTAGQILSTTGASGIVDWIPALSVSPNYNTGIPINDGTTYGLSASSKFSYSHPNLTVGYEGGSQVFGSVDIWASGSGKTGQIVVNDSLGSLNFYGLSQSNTHLAASIFAVSNENWTSTVSDAFLSVKVNDNKVMQIQDSIVSINDILRLNPIANEPRAGISIEGMIYSNSTDNHLYFYNGTSWVQLD